jgi:lipid-A-disaccharide synthase
MRGLRALAPELKFFGAGGPEMAALAEKGFLDWADEAVVGLWDVLRKYGYFKAQFRRLLAELARLKPDALILIDYPGFNLRFAKAVRDLLPTVKIFYYISPQVWAWNRRRIPEMARILDLMVCIFPFEHRLYEKSGLKTVFVGHPMLDSLKAAKTGETRKPDLIGLFPGSREKEVSKILPVFVDAARLVYADSFSDGEPLQFEVAAASPAIARTATEIIGPEQLRNSAETAGTHETPKFRVSVGQAHPLMQRAAVGMVASGTATLEAAYFGMPLVIVYKVTPLTWFLGKRLVKVKFLGMPNILAGREIAREFLQNAATPAAIAREVRRILREKDTRVEMIRNLAASIRQLGEPGAGTRAAQAIGGELGLVARE